MTAHSPTQPAKTGALTGVACIIGSCVSLQLGAALAVQLFPHAGSWATASRGWRGSAGAPANS